MFSKNLLTCPRSVENLERMIFNLSLLRNDANLTSHLTCTEKFEWIDEL